MKYLYNGVPLPALPEWDKETYPYAVIFAEGVDYAGNSIYRVKTYTKNFIFKWYENYEKYYACFADDTTKYKQSTRATTTGDILESDGSTTTLPIWLFQSSIFSVGSTIDWDSSSKSVLWSNFNILNEDGDLIIAASYPIDAETGEEIRDYEIVEFTLTARDLYRKINGKPTKLTLYKKLGGKLIPLDEHTKEVKT